MSLGSIIVRLSLQTGTFETDAGRAAKVAERRAKEIDAAFRKAGLAIGASLGAGLAVAGAGLRKYIQNTIEAEKVQAQLSARIKDTGAAAGRSLEQLNAQADKLQRMTIFDDEAIGEAQAMLLTFKQIQGVQFDKTIESSLDLATVMGIDATDAAKLLGKALADPEKGMSALSRAGVVFTEGERERIKAMAEAGDVAKAQDTILAKLEGTMGTAAEAARNTLGGALQGLQNDFENLLEGDAGSGGVRGTVEAVNALGLTMNDPNIKAGIDNVAGGLLRITQATVEAVAWLGNLGGALNEYIGGLDGMSRTSLQNKRTDLETELFGEQRAQRRSWLGDAAIENSPRVKELKAEIAAIDRQLSLNPAPPSDWVAGRVVSKNGSGRWANVNTPGLPAPSPSPRSSGGGRSVARARAMPDFLGQDTEDLRRMVEETARAEEQFARLSATLSGPLASAEYEHQQNLREIAALGMEAGRTTDEVGRLKDAEVKRYEDERKAIEATLNPMQNLLDAYQAEIDMIGLSNPEKEMMNLLRQKGIDLSSAEAQGYLGAAAAMDAHQKAAESAFNDQMAAMDGLRGATHGLISDLAHGVGVWDALSNSVLRFTDVLIDLASRRLMEQIFGMSGTTGGGMFGGWFFSFLGRLFGGGGAGGWSGSLMGAGAGGSTLGSGLLVSFPGGFKPFAMGGYTGPGGMNEVAGVAHRGEVIWSKGDVARAGGPGVVDAMRRGAPAKANNRRQRIVIVDDKRDAEAMMRGSAGEQAVMVHVERNAGRIKELILGG